MAKELPSGMAVVALSPGVVNTDMLVSCFGSSAALYQTPESWYLLLSVLVHLGVLIPTSRKLSHLILVNKKFLHVTF